MIDEIVKRVNTSGALGRLRDGLNQQAGKATGKVTGEIEKLLGTGLEQSTDLTDDYIEAKRRLRFPIDNANEYRAFIRFQLKGLIPEDPGATKKVEKQKKAASLESKAVEDQDGEKDFVDEVVDQFNAAKEGVEEAFDKFAAGLKKQFTDAEEDLAGEKSDALGATAGDLSLKSKEKLGTYVDLYLPAGVSIADGVQVENVDLGRAGGTVANMDANKINALSAAGSGFEAFTKSVQDGLTGAATSAGGDIAKVGAVQLLSMMPGADKVVGGAKSALGVTTHPNTRAIFRSVNLRAYSFSFKLIPTSAAESNEIVKIIHFFRTQLYPEVIKVAPLQDPMQGGAAISIPIGYRFPNTFIPRIMYRHRQEDPKNGFYGRDMYGITKYKEAYLTNFTATYNPTSMGMIRGGRFQEVDITLSFQEQVALSKADIYAGY